MLTQLFAAVIAPFGGFFASGFKRALRVKDFGDSIPGHGGLTDRMDCQVIMAVFSYIYIDSIVGLGCVPLRNIASRLRGGALMRRHALRRDVTVSGLIEKVERLSSADKLELYLKLKAMVGR